MQQDHFAQQRRFARTTAADDGENLGTAHLQIQLPMHHVRAKPGLDVTQVDDDLAVCGGRSGAVAHVTGPAG